MKNNFDIKQFLIENKVTRNSKIINEEFELGDEDMELAKGLDVKFLTQGDTITPEMWNQESDAIWELAYIDTNKPYKITGFLEDWDGVEDMDGEAAQYVTLQDSNNKEEYEAVYWVKQALKPQFQLEVEPLDLDEEFELGDQDMELAKEFDTSKWHGDNIGDFEEWARPILLKAGFKESYIPDYITDVDGSGIEIYKEMTSEELVDDFKNWIYHEFGEELDEEFELGDNDLELAKSLDFIKVHFTKQDEADELNDMYDEMGGERGMTPEQILIMDADNLNAEGFFENEYESLESLAQEIVPVLGGTVDKWIEALEEMVDLGIIEIYK
jgi:hypothetical protein